MMESMVQSFSHDLGAGEKLVVMNTRNGAELASIRRLD
jgi:hypothetical protein